MAMGVPSGWAAAWATFVETGDSTNANEFHNSGGKFAVAYTNPNYYLVEPGYTAPGNYPNSAFGYGSNGTRTQRPQGGGTEYYLLSNSTASQVGFQGVASAIAAGGGYNYLYADGVSDTLSESLYRMAPTPIEISTDAQYVDGMKALLALSPLPMLVNGYNNGNPVLEEQEYIGSTNVAGAFGEACFTVSAQAYTDSPYHHPWSDMTNALLATTQSGSYAVCGGRGTLADNRALRTYYLASWWLTYDPNYSVSLEEFESNGDVYVFPEQLVVPTSPLQSAGSSIASLKSSTGAYVRQFGACYYDKTAWGACAAIVNASTGIENMPSAASNYHHSLALDNNNLYYGGHASMSSSVPTALGPGTAVILFQ